MHHTQSKRLVTVIIYLKVVCTHTRPVAGSGLSVLKIWRSLQLATEGLPIARLSLTLYTSDEIFQQTRSVFCISVCVFGVNQQNQQSHSWPQGTTQRRQLALKSPGWVEFGSFLKFCLQ